MNVNYVCLILFILYPENKADDAEQSPPKKKIQIGIKKRVDCSLASRSKKGDFLHMHYAVSSFKNYQ